MQSSVKEQLVATSEPVLNEAAWRAWVQKGKLEEQATAKKMKVAIGAILILAALAYVLVLR